jgi:hypothetical protein
VVAVGITTAPRPIPTLDRCLSSARAAGVTGTILVSADGDCLVPDNTVDLHVHEPRLGVLRNWAWTLRKLLERDEDYVLIVQDDVTWARGSWTWLLRHLDASKAAPVPFFTLYVDPKVGRDLERHHSRPLRPGWYMSHLGADSGGALCYGFSRACADVLLKNAEFQYDLSTRDKNIDRIVPKCLVNIGVPMAVRIPGLMHHRLGSGNSSIKVKKPRDTHYWENDAS